MIRDPRESEEVRGAAEDTDVREGHSRAAAEGQGRAWEARSPSQQRGTARSFSKGAAPAGHAPGSSSSGCYLKVQPGSATELQIHKVDSKGIEEIAPDSESKGRENESRGPVRRSEKGAWASLRSGLDGSPRQHARRPEPPGSIAGVIHRKAAAEIVDPASLSSLGEAISEALRESADPLRAEAVQGSAVAQQGADPRRALGTDPMSRVAAASAGVLRTASPAAVADVPETDPRTGRSDPRIAGQDSRNSAQPVESQAARPGRADPDPTAVESSHADKLPQAGPAFQSLAWVAVSEQAGLDGLEGLLEGRGGSAGADVEGLIRACRLGKALDVERALEQGFNVDARHGVTGNTLLHVAAANGHKKICRILLRGRADINAVNYVGDTALHCALALNYRELGGYLYSKGADDSIPNHRGETCYETARSSSLWPDAQTLGPYSVRAPRELAAASCEAELGVAPCGPCGAEKADQSRASVSLHTLPGSAQTPAG